jgi:hypothetical protein
VKNGSNMRSGSSMSQPLSRTSIMTMPCCSNALTIVSAAARSRDLRRRYRFARGWSTLAALVRIREYRRNGLRHRNRHQYGLAVSLVLHKLRQGLLSRSLMTTRVYLSRWRTS